MVLDPSQLGGRERYVRTEKNEVITIDAFEEDRKSSIVCAFLVFSSFRRFFFCI